MPRPSVGRIIHYVSYGTPGGEYPPTCRAAVITEVGQWVTVGEVKAASYDNSEGRPIRTLTQWYYSDAVALIVFNPTGVFLNGAGPVACRYHELIAGESPRGGTWHWSERVEE